MPSNPNEEIAKIKQKIEKKFSDTHEVVAKFDAAGKSNAMDYPTVEKNLKAAYPKLKVSITEVPKI